MSDKKVVFLAHSSESVATETVQIMACSECRNKTWVAEYGVKGSDFPHMKCAVCGTNAGYFGFVSDAEALTE